MLEGFGERDVRGVREGGFVDIVEEVTDAQDRQQKPVDLPMNQRLYKPQPTRQTFSSARQLT